MKQEAEREPCCFSSYIRCNLLIPSCQTEQNGCHIKDRSINHSLKASVASQTYAAQTWQITFQWKINEQTWQRGTHLHTVSLGHCSLYCRKNCLHTHTHRHHWEWWQREQPDMTLRCSNKYWDGDGGGHPLLFPVWLQQEVEEVAKTVWLRCCDSLEVSFNSSLPSQHFQLSDAVQMFHI